MSIAKAPAKRVRKKIARTSGKRRPPAPPKPGTILPNGERVIDPDAPYYGLSKEEFERLAFWRKHKFSPELERAMDWLMENLDSIRAETIEYGDPFLTRAY